MCCVQKVVTDLVSNGTLLLSTQLSCSCTDSGVVGPSPGADGGARMGLRRPLSVLRLRELAEDWWWDSVWWLCGGGMGGPQGGLAVMVWSSWGKKWLKKTFIRLSINYQLAMSKTVLSDAGNVNAITAQWGWSAIRINIKSGTKGRSLWWQPAKAVCVVILSFQIHMQTFRGGREPLKHATTQLVKTLVRQETPVFSFWAVPALLDAVFSYLMKQH